MSDEHHPIISLNSATVARFGGEVALRDLTWTIREGETWAVVGPVGSGKTTLAEVLLGRHRLTAGIIHWPLVDRLRAAGHPIAWPAEVFRHVAFKEESYRFSYGRHYYQQRFNFIEPQDDLTLVQFLRADTTIADTELLTVAGQLGIGDLLPLSFIKLSNGQVRRARIARALLTRPELLILDDPFLGVDSAGRKVIADVLGGLVRDGLRLVMMTRPDAIPDWVTNVLTLVSGRVVSGDWSNSATRSRSPRTTHHSPLTNHPGPPVIELRGVTVAHDGRIILNRVSWTVCAGERWAVLGPNGSGKTTLLSLICGDHPQAYANDVRLFGRRRGTGESIWEVKRRIGLVSPELHLYHSEPLTAAEVAVTGFYDVLARRRATPEQLTAVSDLFAQFGIAALSERSFTRLSTGEQRLVLLVRALVKDPPVLILDEPFQGLDSQAMDRVRNWLDHRLRPDQTLIFVSHYPDEVPGTVSRFLTLESL